MRDSHFDVLPCRLQWRMHVTSQQTSSWSTVGLIILACGSEIVIRYVGLPSLFDVVCTAV